jgi:hypothetical protein
MATDTYATIKELLEAVFSIGSVLRPYKQTRQAVCESHSRVEAGSNTSAVALQVVGGNKKGSLESEAVKYGHESHRTWTQE